MNKAFVREPDDDGRRHCPRCGSLGDAVGAEVLDRYLMPEARARISATGYFCPLPSCETVYFDDFERSTGVQELAEPAYPKDPDAPICACFGLTEDDVELDIAEKAVTRVKALLEKARSPEAHCAELAANGRSCVADVQRYYMRRRGS